MATKDTRLEIRIPYLLTGADPIADEVFDKYANALGQRLRLPREAIMVLSLLAPKLFNLEFEFNGKENWRTSLNYLPRSLCYGRNIIATRWEFLETLALKEPILDYGCGSGYLVAYLKAKTGLQCFAWDTPGAQASVAQDILKKEFDIDWHTEGNHYGTALCFNVLEHVDNPLETVLKLRGMCDQLYANVSTHRDSTDLITEEQIRETLRLLHANGELPPLAGFSTTEESYEGYL